MPCVLHNPGRCYLDRAEMIFRVGQLVYVRFMRRANGSPQFQVLREWIRTRGNQHVVHVVAARGKRLRFTVSPSDLIVIN